MNGTNTPNILTRVMIYAGGRGKAPAKKSAEVSQEIDCQTTVCIHTSERCDVLLFVMLRACVLRTQDGSDVRTRVNKIQTYANVQVFAATKIDGIINFPNFKSKVGPLNDFTAIDVLAQTSFFFNPSLSTRPRHTPTYSLAHLPSTDSTPRSEIEVNTSRSAQPTPVSGKVGGLGSC